MNQRVIFSLCFNNGVRFYTVDKGGFLLWGFLHPDDAQHFSTALAVPRCWASGGGWDYGCHWDNIVTTGPKAGRQEHENTHARLLAQVLDRTDNFCPQRLRRFRV